MTPAIEISNVTVSYFEHIALRSISLQINPGEFVGILGPNGAGKTTLLTVINGLGRIHSGTVRLFGELVTSRTIRHWRSQIGYVPQNLVLDPRLPFDCQEAILLGLYGRLGLFRNPAPADRQRAAELMHYFRIVHLSHRPVGQISGGEQQKVALARALLQEPKILLLDEPTTSLDRRSVQELLELIAEIYVRFRLTVVMVTHLPEHLPSVCSQVVLMKAGRIVWQGERTDGLAPDRLERFFNE
ncbi:MAG: ABC transporter ATP-binding protein [candidate division WOR-3 bacterium]